MLDVLIWFSMPLAAWLIGFIILDPKTFLRFFKQEVYIMDKTAIIIAIVCYGIMLGIIGALSYVH